MISRNACYWIWITLSIGYNNPKVKRISEMYSDVSAFYYGGISEWRLCGIFSQKDLERFSSTALDDAKKIVDRCTECNYSILCIDDELFPKCLYNIECPPALIYINGVMPDIDNTFSIGIVGTRRATKYGIENSYQKDACSHCNDTCQGKHPVSFYILKSLLQGIPDRTRPHDILPLFHH